jgi:hypothetical protein
LGIDGKGHIYVFCADVKPLLKEWLCISVAGCKFNVNKLFCCFVVIQTLISNSVMRTPLESSFLNPHLLFPPAILMFINVKPGISCRRMDHFQCSEYGKCVVAQEQWPGKVEIIP